MSTMHFIPSKVALEIAVKAQVSDTKKLWLLNLILGERVAESMAWRVRRRVELDQVRDLAEGDTVAIVTRGMDCDCCRWENSVSYILATEATFLEWLEDFHRNAEGPQSYYIERPSVAYRLKSSSRDLALEAYENGHPHFITGVEHHLQAL